MAGVQEALTKLVVAFLVHEMIRKMRQSEDLHFRKQKRRKE